MLSSRFRLSAIFFSILLILFSISTAFAQSFPLGVSTYYPVEVEVNDGDIIAQVEGKFVKSTLQYQPAVIGIYVSNPSLEFRPEQLGENDKAIISSGEAYVNVTSKNGEIKRNDFLTSSDISGVAMLAPAKGHVIGTALEDYTATDTERVGKIRVNVFIQDNRASNLSLTETEGINILDIFSASKLALYQSPSESFKYIVAAVVVIISFIFGFLTFRKVAVKGVEAIGRNPLASKVIGLGILLNLVITVSIIIAGLVLAYFIITLGS